MSDNDTQRIPSSNLDFSFMTIEPAWGKEATNELYNLLKTTNEADKMEKNEAGELIVTESSLWGVLSYFTRDLRLGNLNMFLYERGLRYLDLAGDCITRNLIKSFLASLRRVISIVELSQSRNGFLRRRSNTITSEEFSNPLEPDRKGFFGKKKPDGGGR